WRRDRPFSRRLRWVYKGAPRRPLASVKQRRGRHSPTRPAAAALSEMISGGNPMAMQSRLSRALIGPKGQDVRAGNLEVRLANSAQEVDAAQALRVRVFYEQMGAK